MRVTARLLIVFIFSGFVFAYWSPAQKRPARSPRILSAKTVYFDNQTGSAPVGDNALAELKKWGKFQIVSDRKQADLILVLSSDSKLGGHIILSGGQTGTIDSTGHVTEDSVPVYLPPTSTRYAYLNVIDATTGEKLWGAEHVWGGLLTGFNSVGTHLIRELEKQTKK